MKGTYFHLMMVIPVGDEAVGKKSAFSLQSR